MFIALGHSEKALDQIRTSLSRNKDFIIDSAFHKISGGKKIATLETLTQFLKKVGVDSTQKERLTILHTYHTVQFESLELADFVEMTVPRSNQQSREICERRTLWPIATLKQMPLDFEVEYLLTRLFENEILLIQKMSSLVKKIQTMKDFDFMTCFKEIDTTSSGYITQYNLQVFLNHLGINLPTISQWIFRRYAPYIKDKTDLSGFKRIFELYGNKLPEGASSSCSYPSGDNQSGKRGMSSAANSKGLKNKKRSKTSGKHPQSNHKQTVIDMKITQTGTNFFENDGTGYSTAHGGFIPGTTKYISIEEQQIHRDFINKNRRKPVLTKNFLHDSKLMTQNHIKKRGYYELELLKTISKLVELKKNMIKARNDICMKEDFSIITLFLHFDKKLKKRVTVLEAEVALAQLGLYPHNTDLCLLLKTFDTKYKGKLDFEDFYRMVVPEDDTFKEIMESRQNTVKEGQDYVSTVSEETFQCLKKLFNALFVYVAAAEALKQRLVHNVGVDLYQAFVTLPKVHKSYLAVKDLDKLYKLRNIPMTLKDTHEYVRFSDKDKDGKLSYQEFVSSLTPQMDVKYI